MGNLTLNFFRIVLIVLVLPLWVQAQTRIPPTIKTTPISERKFYQLLQDSFEVCYHRIDVFSGETNYNDLKTYARYCNTILYYNEQLYFHGHYRKHLLKDSFFHIFTEELDNLISLDSRTNYYENSIILDDDRILYRYEIKFDLQKGHKLSVYYKMYIEPIMLLYDLDVNQLDELYCRVKRTDAIKEENKPLVIKRIKRFQRWRYNYFKPIVYWDYPVRDSLNPFLWYCPGNSCPVMDSLTNSFECNDN